MDKKRIRKLIVKAGKVKTVITVTAASILFSELVTTIGMFAFTSIRNDPHTRIDVGFTVAFIAPLIVAPIASWFMIDLIVEIDQLEQKMRTLATYDALTGLLNRRAFLEQASYGCRIAEREKTRFSFLMVDVDHFKKINDQHGHVIGDKVLESFGNVASRIKRKSDLAGRVGGEEFAFFLPNTSSEQAWIFAERLHDAIRETIIEEKEIAIRYTISIGLASFSTIKSIESALVITDQALYRAKAQGRNQSILVEDVSESEFA